MSQTATRYAIEETAAATLLPPASRNRLVVEPLTAQHANEALRFLAARPIHTFYLAGLIRDNGVESVLNRGTFYACRNLDGQLEGVALIGHATLIETRTDEALTHFAALARERGCGHMIIGEQEKIELFWKHYAEGESAPRLLCRELLFEQQATLKPSSPATTKLRLATLDDLGLVMPVHAAMALEESGVDPWQVDPVGFRQRCARRIEQGRVWVQVEHGQLIFKADIVSDTPGVIYLEGIYVANGERGKGTGQTALYKLCRTLLSRTKSICLLVNEQNRLAQAFYLRAGFKLRSHYDTIFLR